jgi:hypothetical protein
MAWFSRISRWGDIHLVFGQRWQNSCGLASVLMCVFKTNKLTPGASSFRVETEVRDRYTQLLGSAYDPATTGTFPQHLVTILNEFTNVTWAHTTPSVNDVSGQIVRSVGETSALVLGPTLGCSPVIVGIDWTGGGAHWVVIDSVRSLGSYRWATICDPWDTNLHINRFRIGHPFTYDAGDVVAGVDIGGGVSQAGGNVGTGGTSRTATYAGTGQVANWGVIYQT